MVVTRNQQGLKSAYRSEVLKFFKFKHNHKVFLLDYEKFFYSVYNSPCITVELYTEVHFKNVLNIFKMRVGKIAKL